jgi:hypothetical protein
MIPATVEHIDDTAFYNCENLSELVVAEENEHYCVIDHILYDKPVTRIMWIYPKIDGKVVIADGVTNIPSFNGNWRITEVVLPNSVTHIQDYAFAGSFNLRSIYLPKSLLHIGNNAFADCERLQNVTLPENVQTIGGMAFSGCTKIDQLTIPSAVVEIGEGAFANCEHLDELTIPDSVEQIDDCAFRGCSSLEKIVIPRSVKELGWGIFDGCSNDMIVYCDEGSAVHKYCIRNRIKNDRIENLEID